MKSRKFRQTLLCLSLVAMIANQSYAKDLESLTPELAKAAERHAHQLIESFPPSRYFLVMFGLTTPLYASTMRLVCGSPQLCDRYMLEVPVQNYLDVTDPAKFWSRILPARDEINGRELVFVRMLNTGTTVDYYFARHAQKIIASRGDQQMNAYFIARSSRYNMARGRHENTLPFLERLQHSMEINLGGKIIVALDQLLGDFIIDEKYMDRLNRNDLNTYSMYLKFNPQQVEENPHFQMTDSGRWYILDDLIYELNPGIGVAADKSASPPLARFRRELMAMEFGGATIEACQSFMESASQRLMQSIRRLKP